MVYHEVLVFLQLLNCNKGFKYASHTKQAIKTEYQGALIFLLIDFFLFGQGSPFINPKNFPGNGLKVNDIILPSHINCKTLDN